MKILHPVFDHDESDQYYNRQLIIKIATVRMPNPNFFIIGAPKCGVVTVSSWLRGHSMVDILDHAPKNFHATDLSDRDKDKMFYDSCYSQCYRSAVGEMSDWYLFSETAVKNVLNRSPDARFIVCLRNPIDLAWVLHSSAVAEASEHVSDFSTAWAMSHLRGQGRGSKFGTDPKTMDYASICALGSQLLRLASLVSADRIHLVFLEDILVSPQDVWVDLLSFLEIDYEPCMNFETESFLIERPHRGLHVFFRRASGWRKSALLKHIGCTGFSEMVDKWNRRVGTIRPMPTPNRRRVCDHLSEDIALISALSGRDLSHWLC